MKIFIIFLLLCGSLYAADSTNSVADIIQFGATNSTLIVSGKFGGTAAGGGGATSQVEISKVFQSPRDFQTPKQIVVSWFTGKYSGFHALQLTNSYIFFLRPHTTNSDTAYRDVTDMQPFVEASEANISVLKSHLADDLKTDDWGVATNNLQISIKLEGGEHQVKAGQPYGLVIRYRNIATNDTFAIYEVNGTVDDSSYSFHVTSPSGKDVSPDTSKIPMYESGGICYAPPGQMIEIKFNLSAICRLDEVGVYKITVKKAQIISIAKNKMFEAVSNPLNVTVVANQ